MYVIIFIAVGTAICCITACTNRFDYGDADNTFTVTYDTMTENGAENQVVFVGDKLTAPDVPTRDGYVFAGWYTDSQFTEEWNFSTNEVTGNTVLYAKWLSLQTVTAPKHSVKLTKYPAEGGIVYFDRYDGQDETERSVSEGQKVSVSALTNPGYTFTGWYDGNTLVSEKASLTYSFYMPEENKEYTAKWIKVNIEKNLPEAGEVSRLDGAYIVGEQVTVTASTNARYTWLGWFDGETEVSKEKSLTYTFEMTDKEKTYTAKWMPCPVTIQKNISVAGTVSGIDGATVLGKEYTLHVSTNPGYVWDGWYSVSDSGNGVTEKENCVSHSLNYQIKIFQTEQIYIAKWKKWPVTFETNYPLAGKISAPEGNYSIGDRVTVTAETNVLSVDNEAYVWLGWYDGDIKVSEGTSLSYTFNIPSQEKTYTAKWARIMLLQESTMITQSGLFDGLNKAFNVGDRAEITALTQPGYTWVGWFDGMGVKNDQENLLTRNLTYSFNVTGEDTYLTAQWVKTDVIKNIDEAGYVTVLEGQYFVGDTVTISAMSNEGYIWLGWDKIWQDEFGVEKNEQITTEKSCTFSMTAKNVKYVAKWAETTYEKTIGAAGVVNYVVQNGNVNMTAVTNSGYTWVGWYDGETKVSDGTNMYYSFNLSYAVGKKFIAKWIKVFLGKNMSEAGTVTEPDGTYLPGDEVTVTATTNPGYTWLGWYDGDTKVSDSTSLSFMFNMPEENKTYTAKWYKIFLTKNIEDAGSIIQPTGKYVVGSEATLTATTNAGYTWIGWYDGETKVSEGTSLSYTFNMPDANNTFTAKWIKVDLMADENLSKAGTVPMLTGTYVYGEEVTVSAVTNPGYTFIGWYDGIKKVSDEGSYDYTFKMPVENKIYIAKWVVCPITLEKNISDAGFVRGVSEATVIGGETTIIARTNPGYTFVGWYDGIKKVSDNTGFTYTFVMTIEEKKYIAKWIVCPITLSKNIDKAGDVGGIGEATFVGEKKTVTAKTHAGYTWIGWYDGETKVSEGTSLSYTFDMPDVKKIYTAKWIKVNLEKNISEAGTISKLEGTYIYGDEVTVTASTNAGYTWSGWYEGDTKVSEGTNLTFTFSMPMVDKTYIAKWAEYTIKINSNDANAGSYTEFNGTYSVRFNLNGAIGTAPAMQTITGTTGLTYPDIPTRDGYLFAGWFDNSECCGTPFDFSDIVRKDIILYAKWVSYNGSGTLQPGGFYRLSVQSETIIQKYAFVPLITETITIFTSGYAIDTYGVLYDNNDEEVAYDNDSGSGKNFSISYEVTAGEVYYLSVFAKNGDIGETALYVGMNQKPVDGGTVDVGRRVAGESVTISAKTNDGYTWLGWYDGTTKVSEGSSMSYTFVMPSCDKTYVAKWMPCPITIEINVSEAGAVHGVSGATSDGEEITVSAERNPGYIWKGWYEGNIKVNEGTSLSYTFIMSTENKTYTAIFETCTNHAPDENCICSICGALSHTPDENCICTKCGATAHGIKDGVYCRHGEFVYFGYYPQSEVKDYFVLEELNSLYSELPTITNEREWTSYGYCSDDGMDNYMWYVDKFYNGEKYRGVYFSAYRPYQTVAGDSAENGYQDDNGYVVNTVYWFRYEPIKWRILTEGNGEALILCDMIIDSQEFYSATSDRIIGGKTVYANNYAESNIRKWLNDNFYNTAFSSMQKELILLTTVDNSARSTNPDNNASEWNGGDNPYECYNTEDLVFLLSEQEVTNSAYGFSGSCGIYDTDRRKQTSEYAQCQGVYVSTGGEYDGNGCWWLRSACYNYSSGTRYVSVIGSSSYNSYVYVTHCGVVPALRIKLS